MNKILVRIAALCVLWTLSLPVAGQMVRVESQGEAFAAAEDKAIAEAFARQVIGIAPADKGLIVFFRSLRSAGNTIDVRVSENDNEIADLSGGRYFVIAVSPGTHTFTVDTGTGEGLTLQVDPGQTQYVRATDRFASSGRPYLVRTDAGVFLKAATGRRKTFR